MMPSRDNTTASTVVGASTILAHCLREIPTVSNLAAPRGDVSESFGAESALTLGDAGESADSCALSSVVTIGTVAAAPPESG
ncbi:hypothetical protein NCAST_13_01160 [Nocardia asteroides NBRC 15531]|uniref:Uncharacterized protein n=1 Tax=Nocardia asteroides NBRC 15531 TaxID=1110697 RepID=U5E8S9_NOCAS|nr:hypothetical protein NCAST_13_01160 [Nocardia asteroides NBRC 15531]